MNDSSLCTLWTIGPSPNIHVWTKKWEAVPCVRRLWKTPRKVPVCGVRTMLKLQMAACKDYSKEAKKQMTEHCSKALMRTSTSVSSVFAFLAVDSFAVLSDSEIKRRIDLKASDF